VAPWFHLDTVVAMVDAVHAQGQLDTHAEAVKQIAVADLLLLSKTDLADAAGVEALTDRLAQINRAIQIVPILRGSINPHLLFGHAALGPQSEAHDVERWLGRRGETADGRCELATHEHCDHGHASAVHDDRVQSFTLFHDTPTTPQALASWLTLLASFRGANLLRVKGLINVEGRPVVVQAVQTVIHEPVELAQWPGAERRSQVVFIVRDADRARFERSLDALSAGVESARGRLLDPAAYARFVEMAKTLS
jgi:G3E family GTPase